jgi:hypothetical protein
VAGGASTAAMLSDKAAPRLTDNWGGAKKNRLQFRALVLRTLAYEV